MKQNFVENGINIFSIYKFSRKHTYLTSDLYHNIGPNSH